MKHHKEYIEYRQKQLKEKLQRAAELEFAEEEARVAKQEEIDTRKKLLLEQQENERLHQNNIQRKEIEKEAQRLEYRKKFNLDSEEE